MDKSLIRLILTVALCLPCHAQILSGILSPSAGVPTPVVTHVADCGANGTPANTLTCTINGVTAGDLIESCVAASTTSTTIAVSDGTSSFAAGAQATGSTITVQCFWLLSANGGNKTYTVTFGNPSVGDTFWVQQIHAGFGTWHIDTGNQNTGFSTAVNTGDVTTANGQGEAILFIALLSNIAATASNPLIGVSTPTELSSSPQNTYQHAYYLLNTRVLAGAGELTYSIATDWGGAMVACYAQ